MGNLAGFPFRELNQKYLDKPANDAFAYGVSIVPARSLSAYRCIGVYHLKPEENNRRRNIFVEVLDQHGKRDRQPMINWTVSTDRPMQSKPLDKPDDEPATDIPMNAQDTVTVRVNDGTPGGDSDSVGGFHTRHPDEDAQNTWGHHSFYVVFQRSAGITTEPEEPPTSGSGGAPPTPPDSTEKRLAALEQDITTLKRAFAALIREWQGD